MGSDVTWSRPTPGFEVKKFHDNGYVTDPVDFGGLGTPVQTTTSFRTGRAVPVGFDEGDFQSYKDYADYFRALKDELSRGSQNWGSPDTGHVFSSMSQWSDCSMPRAVVLGQPRTFVPYYQDDSWYVWEGPLVPSSGKFESYFPTVPAWLTQTVDGVTAINQTIPTRSAAGLNVALSEFIHEGLPRILGASALGARALLAKKAGGEYLNFEFGWKPLVSDIKQIAQSVVNANQTLRQFERDSGRRVRRRYSFPDTNESVDLTVARPELAQGSVFGFQGQGMSQWFSSAWASGGGPQSATETTLTSRWFSGQYQYYVNPGLSTSGKLARYEQMANHLLGIRLTPDVLWELSPWSWLFDWITDIGNVIQNASDLSSDSLVIRYAYLMRTAHTTRTLNLSGAVLKSTGPIGTLQGRFGVIQKNRVKATPFGFGLNSGGFSLRQWAILGALGLTKSPNSLHGVQS